MDRLERRLQWVKSAACQTVCTSIHRRMQAAEFLTTVIGFISAELPTQGESIDFETAQCTKFPYNDECDSGEYGFVPRKRRDDFLRAPSQLLRLQSLMERECPISLKSYKQLIDSDDLVVTWCCHYCMSRSALQTWFEEFSGQYCPNCRSGALKMQILGRNDQRCHGKTVLHMLAEEPDTCNAIDEYLDSHPDDINAFDSFNNTPLHIAIFSNHVETVKLLCERGCDVNRCLDSPSPIFEVRWRLDRLLRYKHILSDYPSRERRYSPHPFRKRSQIEKLTQTSLRNSVAKTTYMFCPILYPLTCSN